MKTFRQLKSKLNRSLHSIWAPIILGGSLLMLIVGLRLVTASHESIPERPPVSEEPNPEENHPTFLEIKNALDEVLLAYQVKAKRSVRRNSKTEIWKAL